LPKIGEYIENEIGGGKIIPYSATYELEVSKGQIIPGKDDMPKSLIHKIIKSGFKILDLINFFTVGYDEVRAWTVKKNTLAPKAAGVIHSDFQKGFISVDVFRYKDLKKLGSEGKIREAGKRMTKGKDYIVKDGDIVHFKCNTSGTKKKKKK